jgi:hypothetical protein
MVKCEARYTKQQTRMYINIPLLCFIKKFDIKVRILYYTITNN